MASRAGERTQTAGGLGELVAKLGPIKDELSKLKKQEEPLVSKIKGELKAAGLQSFESSGYKVSITETPNDALNEAQAIAVLKHELKDDPHLLSLLIQTKEVINDEALESAIFKRQVPEGILATAIESKPPTVRLMCKKQKSTF